MPADPVAVEDPLPSRPVLVNGLSEGHGLRDLHARVVDALYSLPRLFKTTLNITGVRATDLFSLNSALGASIERSVVDSLNELRELWDPRNEFPNYAFARQATAFPDVRLQTDAPGQTPVLLGIELKGWFALAKEGEPSFRYTVNPSVCAEPDLLVVYPWLLSEVISGSPVLTKPFVTKARYAAELRNYYWAHLRGRSGDEARIIPATYQQPYPPLGAKYNDAAAKDSGRNFGRPRGGGLMDAYIAELMKSPAAGIPIDAWQSFFRIFSERFTPASVQSAVGRIRAEFPQADLAESELAALAEAIARLVASAQAAVP